MPELLAIRPSVKDQSVREYMLALWRREAAACRALGLDDQAARCERFADDWAADGAITLATLLEDDRD